MGENTGSGRISAVLRSTECGLIASIVMLLGLIYVLAPPNSFFTSTTQLSLLHQISLYGVLAIGRSRS